MLSRQWVETLLFFTEINWGTVINVEAKIHLFDLLCCKYYILGSDNFNSIEEICERALFALLN